MILRRWCLRGKRNHFISNVLLWYFFGSICCLHLNYMSYSYCCLKLCQIYQTWIGVWYQVILIILSFRGESNQLISNVLWWEIVWFKIYTLTLSICLSASIFCVVCHVFDQMESPWLILFGYIDQTWRGFCQQWVETYWGIFFLFFGPVDCSEFERISESR